MKKTILTLGLIGVTLLSGCGVLYCQADGCERDVYKEGYCKLHYAEYLAKEGADALIDSILGDN